MATHLYLAMTAAEYHAAHSLPSHMAWMACHFSPYALGLSNLPEELPSESILILSDLVPIHGHSGEWIAQQLNDYIQKHHCRGLLLDFQRAPCSETEHLTDLLLQTVSCPIAVADPFAQNRSCPVFLPPCPPYIPLKEYLTSWGGREIWLETAFSPTQLLLTPSGTTVSPGTSFLPDVHIFEEEQLHCHYQIQPEAAAVRFHLQRTAEDLNALMEEGASLGVRQFLGLYQELGDLSQQFLG